jgi:hypothetical protein
MLLILGIVLLVISGILLLIRVSQQKKLGSIARAEVTSIGQLKSLAGAVGGELQQLGSGAGFSQLVALSGQVRADDPLVSELGGDSCVYYSYTVEREYEETYQETDSSSGRQVTKTRTQTDNVARNERRCRFVLDDGTGTVTVEPESADMDSEKVVERFEPTPGTPGGVFQIGSFSVAWESSGIGDRRTVGYRYRENALKVGSSAFVLGQANASGGDITIRKPDRDAYLISLKSREQLVGSARSAVKWLLYGAVAMDAAGVVLIVLSFLRP